MNLTLRCSLKKSAIYRIIWIQLSKDRDKVLENAELDI